MFGIQCATANRDKVLNGLHGQYAHSDRETRHCEERPFEKVLRKYIQQPNTFIKRLIFNDSGKIEINLPF